MEETTPKLVSYMSENINEISAALSAFQGSVEQPKLEKEVKVKTKTGGSYSFKYADLCACVKAATPARLPRISYNHLLYNLVYLTQVYFHHFTIKST